MSDKSLFAGTGRHLTPAEQKRKMELLGFSKSTPQDKKAEKHAQKVDPHWEMADRPTWTKGHKALDEALKKFIKK
jgi:hypothetical protein